MVVGKLEELSVMVMALEMMEELVVVLDMPRLSCRSSLGYGAGAEHSGGAVGGVGAGGTHGGGYGAGNEEVGGGTAYGASGAHGGGYGGGTGTGSGEGAGLHGGS
ncbi:glycine-rich cell wall structural protein 1.8-like [Papaver somniferum]|uniref:glycine-rich cell wall structural protein 1.8-like n=1 Tax=Papaver somniferum TaxID=3469 RepID=UPI000E6F5573|nr:glycine-rich cell wall structural protein 1.8-like [Papaver somniferum]